MDIVDKIEKENSKKRLPEFKIGDTVDVHVRIKEGDKERIQLFSGVVIRRIGGGIRETFTVRRIVQGEGVERIFPIHSPFVEKVVVRRGGKVRRAKLYYLRELSGKKARLRERLLTKDERELARKTVAGELEKEDVEPEDNPGTEEATEPVEVANA